MKNLLQKTLKSFIIFTFVVFMLSIPSYFFVIDWIWQKELDKNNKLIAKRIENQFNKQQISNEKLEERIRFWNEIQPISKINPTFESLKKDSTYTILRQNPFLKKKSIDRFRGLVTIIKINNENFKLTLEINVEESEETLTYISLITILFFFILVVGFWILNRKLSQKLWKPFRDTLQKLKAFRLDNHTKIELPQTDITEFYELNTALDKLFQHSISTYKSQKKFTENASHELQTPVAIIKSKLDLLLQDQSLTDKQYDLIEEINKSLLRMSGINKNLLLLSKIENGQFTDVQEFYLSDILKNIIGELEDFITEKNIKIRTEISQTQPIQSNLALSEILVSNLLLNAVRYTEKNNEINIKLYDNQLVISNKGNEPLNKNILFKRFKKTSAQSKGSGLGLAIVREICHNNDWEISYVFEKNQHCFIVDFLLKK